MRVDYSWGFVRGRIASAAFANYTYLWLVTCVRLCFEQFEQPELEISDKIGNKIFNRMIIAPKENRSVLELPQVQIRSLREVRKIRTRGQLTDR